MAGLGETVAKLYSEYKAEDNFLHIEFAELSSFG